MIRVYLLAVILAFASSRLNAQQTVTTTGGIVNEIPLFSGNTTVIPSSLWNVEIFPNGLVGQGSNDFGSMAFGPDNGDGTSSSFQQAGPQLHFRLTRAYCDKTSTTRQTSSDQTNFFCVPDAVTVDATHPMSSTPNKSFIIAPYKFGMGISYPGLVEFATQELSVHMNHDLGGTSGAHLWVGDNDDYGGILSTAADVLVSGALDRSRSFVSMTSQTFTGTSHGDFLFSIRDSQDSFRFQQGPNGGAESPSVYKQYTKARIDSTGKGFFDGGTQT
jgi:hypothetical protein